MSSKYWLCALGLSLSLGSRSDQEVKNHDLKNSVDAGEGAFLSKIRQLTFGGERSGEGYFSPDGKKMIFQSEREAGNPFYQMYVMDLEAGRTSLVSTGRGRTTCGWLHPNGKELLFSSSHEDPEVLSRQEQEYKRRLEGGRSSYAWDFDPFYEIYLGPSEGPGELVNLSKSPGYDAEAAWSPGGQWIVFSSNRSAYLEELSPEEKILFKDNPSYFAEIYLMKSDGSGLRRLTNTPGYDGGPFFSADGKKITWRRFAATGFSAEIMVMDLDTQEEKQLTRLDQVSWAPFFHPSGDYLIFSSSLYGHDNYELFVVDAEGQHEPVRVTATPGFDGLPVFRPGHQQLAWTSNRGGQSQIYLAHWNDEAARAALGLADLFPSAKDFSPEIKKSDLKKQLSFLASPRLEGRATGSSGEAKAREFVSAYFSKVGLKPAFPDLSDGGYQTSFDFESGVSVSEGTTLVLAEENLELGKDYLPLNFSQDGVLSQEEFVFAGYGLRSFLEGAPSYDSYAHKDVKGKWVIAFRYLPEDLSVAQKVKLQPYSSPRAKAALAKSLGAKGLIFISGPRSGVKNELIALTENQDRARFDILGLSVSDRLGAKLLGLTVEELENLQGTLDRGENPVEDYAGALGLRGQISLKRETTRSFNVLARLNSENPQGPALLLGAHLDHLGVGEGGEIYYGADDNASGVSLLLEVAHFLKSHFRQSLRRDIIFAAWSGEEHGLLGSADLVRRLNQSEGGAKAQIGAILNFDMIGRYRSKLSLQGYGSSKDWAFFLEQVAFKSRLDLSLEKDPYLPTDSTSFYLAEIPGLQFFTGSHEDYHKPTDTSEKINYGGLKAIAELAKDLTLSLANAKHLPRYQAVGSGDTGSGPLRVSLGTVPDYTRSDVKGVYLSGVKPDSPAALAGLKAGDIITSLAGEAIGNIYDYTRVLGALKAEVEVEIVVLREGQELKLLITPQARS